MNTTTWRIRFVLVLVAGLLSWSGGSIYPRVALAQSQVPCPLPVGGTPVGPPEVTATQVENGTGSLMDFALSSRDQFVEQGRQAQHNPTAGRNLYLACLIRQEDGPWRSGSTYLVTLTPDGRIFIHAEDMSFSGRLLNRTIYAAILQALGISPAALADPAAARAALRAAEAGNGGSFEIPNVPGASGYASVYTSLSFGAPIVLLAGFDLDETHLAAEQIDYGDPAVTAEDVVDRATLKAFVTQAGNFFMELLKTRDQAAVAKAATAMRDPNGPWRHGSVYLYVWDLTIDTIIFHAAFPDVYEFRPLRPVARDAITGEYILPPLIEAAKSGPEGGFHEYHFDDPTDDTDSADIPKVGYVRAFSDEIARPDGTTRRISFVVGSGFYASERVVDSELENTVVESVLPQVMRAMTASTVDAVSSRIDQASSDTAPKAAFSLGGVSTLSDTLLANANALQSDSFDLARLLAGSSFTLPLDAAGTGSGPFGGLTFWGSGDYRRMSGGNPQSVDYDGTVTSANLGIDTKLGVNLLGGLAVSKAQGSVDYTASSESTGELTSFVTSLNPYVSWQLAHGMKLWAIGGLGSGEVEVDGETADASASDLTQHMFAVGASGPSLTIDGKSEDSTTTLRLKGEAAFTWTDIDGSPTLARTSLRAGRQRVMFEGEHVLELESGATFAPSLEIGLRNDAGDGETGTGIEVGGAVRYAAAASGLTVEGRLRTLLSHRGDYEETGVSASVRVAPGASGRGFALVVQPAWGRTSSGVQRLWEHSAPAAASADHQARLNAEIGYGLGVAHGLGLVTPYAGLGLAGEDERSWRIGARWQVATHASVNVEGMLREGADDDGPEHSLMLGGALRW